MTQPRRQRGAAAASVESLVAIALVAFPMVASTLARADPPGSESDAGLEAFFDRHCLDCHRGRRAAGGVVLDRLALDPHDPELDAELLLRVRDRLRAGDMPPIDVEATVEENLEFRPSAEEYDRMVGG
ncbi:MAG: c-type cytochrome domain-containing protein, partial [Planctomycetota bacterium]|nr:c-type cytochrome domain-containing protein [Planctomycetota bacterium]